MVNEKGQTEKEFLEKYNEKKYERPSVTVDMTIFTVINEEKENYRKLEEKKLKILLIQRKDHPYINQWALPGGFVMPNESTEEAAVRELYEETNLENVYLEQLYTFSNPKRDPRMWVITCAYMALIDSKKVQIKAGDEASEANWFEVLLKVRNKEQKKEGEILKEIIIYQLELICGEIKLTATVKKEKQITINYSKIEYEIIDCQGVAFDHAKIITVALERLRGKIEYTDIAFNLMPTYFTLTELQKVYESILDINLLPANFRRKVKHLVEETEQYTEGAGHRPSKLFKRI